MGPRVLRCNTMTRGPRVMYYPVAKIADREESSFKWWARVALRGKGCTVSNKVWNFIILFFSKVLYTLQGGKEGDLFESGIFWDCPTYSLVHSLRHIVCLHCVTAGENMGGPPSFLFSKVFCVGISRMPTTILSSISCFENEKVFDWFSFSVWNVLRRISMTKTLSA